jgi:hypothetical protein
MKLRFEFLQKNIWFFSDFFRPVRKKITIFFSEKRFSTHTKSREETEEKLENDRGRCVKQIKNFFLSQ